MYPPNYSPMMKTANETCGTFDSGKYNFNQNLKNDMTVLNKLIPRKKGRPKKIVRPLDHLIKNPTGVPPVKGKRGRKPKPKPEAQLSMSTPSALHSNYNHCFNSNSIPLNLFDMYNISHNQSQLNSNTNQGINQNFNTGLNLPTNQLGNMTPFSTPQLDKTLNSSQTGLLGKPDPQNNFLFNNNFSSFDQPNKPPESVENINYMAFQALQAIVKEVNVTGNENNNFNYLNLDNDVKNLEGNWQEEKMPGNWYKALNHL